MTDQETNKNQYHWLMWWRTNPEEIQEQALEYHNLKIHQSARGVSVLCLIFSFFVSCLFVYLGEVPSENLIDAFALLVVAFFIYRGHRWPIIFSMIYWTVVKGWQIFDYIVAGQAGMFWPMFIWWTIYMHAFYMALKIENLRRSKRRADEEAIS